MASYRSTAANCNNLLLRYLPTHRVNRSAIGLRTASNCSSDRTQIVWLHHLRAHYSLRLLAALALLLALILVYHIQTRLH